MPKFTVDYGTIKGMVVELPEGGFNTVELLRAWVAGFIAYMTANALVSDEVLCSSIGKSNALAALIAGVEERLPEGEQRKNFVTYCSSPENWRSEVIRQRRGVRAAFADRFGEELTKRAVEAGLI